MKFYKLEHYVDMLKRGEKFSLARYGDGELYCMWGSKSTSNANGCYYTPHLRKALLETMNPKPGFIYGLQRVIPRDEKRVMAEYPHIDWHDSEFLSEAVSEGKLFPLIEQLRKMRVVVIGNETLAEPTRKLFDWARFIYVPKSNAFEEEERVIKDILQSNSAAGDTVYLFSCGMAANAFVWQLHGMVDGWLLDVGHIWDPFAGLMSRCDLEGKTENDIAKNLKP